MIIIINMYYWLDIFEISSHTMYVYIKCLGSPRPNKKFKNHLNNLFLHLVVSLLSLSIY